MYSLTYCNFCSDFTLYCLYSGKNIHSKHEDFYHLILVKWVFFNVFRFCHCWYQQAPVVDRHQEPLLKII